MVKALLDRSDLTQENQKPVAVCLNTAIKEQTNTLDNLTTANKCFTIDDIKKEKRAEYWISSRIRNKGFLLDRSFLSLTQITLQFTYCNQTPVFPSFRWKL